MDHEELKREIERLLARQQEMEAALRRLFERINVTSGEPQQLKLPFD